MYFSRRRFFHLAGAAGLLLSKTPKQLQAAASVASGANSSADGPAGISLTKARVALTHGEQRRKNVYEALLSIDQQIQKDLTKLISTRANLW